MPRYPRTPVPVGYIVCETSDRTWFARSLSGREEQSPEYTRRLQAINWCLLRLGREALPSRPRRKGDRP